MMGWWPFSESLTVGIFSIVFGGGAAALINAAVQKTLKRNDLAAAGLSSVIGGYKTLTDQLQERIEALVKEHAEIEEECARRMKKLESDMQAQTAEYVRQLKHLEDEMERRESVWNTRVADLERRLRGLDK